MYESIKIILVDIEGTTSSISFVHEVLFPYARKALKSFLENNLANKDVQNIIKEAYALEDKEYNSDLDNTVSLFQKWIDADKKYKPLKDLQGLIWQQGYAQKDFYGHIYEDAYLKLKEWQEKYKIYVYSSGSIQAQKLIFGHTEYGDLNHFFSGNFDTGIGAKKDRQSYKNIFNELKKDFSDLKEKEILFLSDNSDELKAAQAIGINVIKLARPQDGISADLNYHSISSFSALSF